MKLGNQRQAIGPILASKRTILGLKTPTLGTILLTFQLDSLARPPVDGWRVADSFKTDSYLPHCELPPQRAKGKHVPAKCDKVELVDRARSYDTFRKES